MFNVLNSILTKFHKLGIKGVFSKTLTIYTSEGFSGLSKRFSQLKNWNGSIVLPKKSGLMKFFDIASQNASTNREVSHHTLLIHVQLFQLSNLKRMIPYLRNVPIKFNLIVCYCDKKGSCVKNLFNYFQELPNLQSVKIIAHDEHENYFAQIEKDLNQNQLLLCLNDFEFSRRKISLWFMGDEFYRVCLNSKHAISEIILKFDNPKVSLIYTEPYFRVNEIDYMGRWFYGRENLLKQFGINKCFVNDLYCPNGMFFARIETIKSVLNSYFNTLFTEASSVYTRIIPAYVIDKKSEVLLLKNPNLRSLKCDSTLEAKYKIRLEFFDQQFYTATYPDVAEKMDTLKHYRTYGIREGRKGFASYPWHFLLDQLNKRNSQWNKNLPKDFDAKFYLTTYLDAAEDFLYSNIFPFEHYLLKGKKLGYLINSIELIQTKNELDNKAALKFSVVIPVFNSAETIAHCLDSVLKQTYKNIEIVAVDDGSQDDSLSILEKYRNDYPDKMKVVIHKENKGLVLTHKDGVAEVSGDYFTVLDGDDWLDENFCKTMLTVAQTVDADCVCCKWTRPTKYSSCSFIKQDDILGLRVLDDMIKINSIVNWSSELNIHYGLNRKIYKTAVWRKVDPIQISSHVLYWEDASVTIKFMLDCGKVALIENYLYNWFNNPNSVSNVPLSNRYIDNMFSVQEDLSFLLQSDLEQVRDIFVRNTENIFLGEFLKRLKNMVRYDKNESQVLIRNFAKKLLNHEKYFTENQLNRLNNKITRLYFDCLKNQHSHSEKNKICFIDPVGIRDIKNHFLSFWSEHSNVAFEYIGLEKYSSLETRIKNIDVGNDADLVVTSGGWSADDFNTIRPIVQLWHGMGAIKKVDTHPVFMRPVIAFCSSEGVRPIYAQLFGVDEKKVLPYGSIVADDYLNSNKIADAKSKFLKAFPECANKKVYLWAPTFRGKSPHLRAGDRLDWSALSEQLHDDEVFLVKFHPAIKQYDRNFSSMGEYDKIIDVTDYPELMDILSVTSVYMGDYSSSVHYALLLDVPVCFLITDFKQYSYEQGLLLTLDEFPGEVCQSVDVETIVSMIRRSKITEKYLEFKMHHLGGCTGNSKLKVFESINNLINKA